MSWNDQVKSAVADHLFVCVEVCQQGEMVGDREGSCVCLYQHHGDLNVTNRSAKSERTKKKYISNKTLSEIFIDFIVPLSA